MSRVNLQDAFQTPFRLLGEVPFILVPSLIASVVGLALSMGLRGAFLRGMGWQVFVVAVVSQIAVLFSMVWVALLLDQSMRGEKVSLQDSWVKLSERLANVGLATLLVAVIVTLGTFFYIVPGILLASLLLPAIPHGVVENASFDVSAGFSFRFVFSQGNFWVVFLMVLIAFLLGFLPYIDLFLGNLFITLWLPYLALKYGVSE